MSPHHKVGLLDDVHSAKWYADGQWGAQMDATVMDATTVT